MKENDEVEMEIFRAGDYGAKGIYSAEDLQQMAADYRPDLLEAPLTFDHAQTGPAYGWVTRLRRDGDRLVAVLKGVPGAVRELVRSGAYKRRSVELFRTLPHTGRPYLRAVSMLGAATPEVKGLRDVCFASGQQACQVALSVDEPAPESSGESGGGAAEASASAAEDASPQTPQKPEVNPLHSQLEALFSDLRRDGFCLAESDVRAVQAFVLGATGGASSTAAFSDDTAAAAAPPDAFGWLNQLLRRGLLRAPLGEASPAHGPFAGDASAVTFSERTEPASFALHQAALLVQTAGEMSYREALLQAARDRARP